MIEMDIPGRKQGTLNNINYVRMHSIQEVRNSWVRLEDQVYVKSGGT